MKKWIVMLIAVGLLGVMPNMTSATLLDFSFADDYLVENWNPDTDEVLPSEVFGILFYAPVDYDFTVDTVEKMKTNVPNWMVFHNSEIPLYFGYMGTKKDNPFVPGSSITLEPESVGGSDYQFDFTLDFVSSSFLPGKKIEFPVHLYYENEGGVAHSEGSMFLVGIPEPTTLAMLGIGTVFCFFVVMAGAEVVDFSRR